MKIDAPEYEIKRLLMIKENRRLLPNFESLEALIEEYSEAWLKKKANTMGYQYNEFISYILKNRVFARHILTKDPVKQNFAEKIWKDWLDDLNSKESLFVSAEMLPNRRYSVLDGNVVKGTGHLNKYGNKIKSIDAHIILKNGLNIYTTNKYTMEAGGAQDNQCNDAIKSILETKDFSNHKHIAVLDGKYYERIGRKTQQTKIQEINNLEALSKNASAVDSVGFISIINALNTQTLEEALASDIKRYSQSIYN